LLHRRVDGSDNPTVVSEDVTLLPGDGIEVSLPMQE
jgi:hypothetical protein